MVHDLRRKIFLTCIPSRQTHTLQATLVKLSSCNQLQLCPEEMSPLVSHFYFLFEGSAHDINWVPSQPTSLNMTLQTGPVFISNNMEESGGTARKKT